MNARLDIHPDGTATVQRDGRKYELSVRLVINEPTLPLAKYWAADALSALADEFMRTLDEPATDGQVRAEGEDSGEWEIF